MKQYQKVLTIAGSDSGGGAGIQADLKTFSALGCYGASAITAITVQNTLGVEAVHPVPIDILRGQIDCVLSDIGADAIKIGMLHSAEVVEVVSQMIDKHQVRSVVLDPVMVSTSGHRLIEEQAIGALQELLVPRARLITPNIPEAEILVGHAIGGQDELADVARSLSLGGRVSVLLKAGHLKDDRLVDILYNAESDEIIPLESQRLYTTNTHGTGCTLSSAVAAMLARGEGLTEAVRKAKEYLTGALSAGADYIIGHGHGPVDHLWLWR